MVSEAEVSGVQSGAVSRGRGSGLELERLGCWLVSVPESGAGGGGAAAGGGPCSVGTSPEQSSHHVVDMGYYLFFKISTMLAWHWCLVLASQQLWEFKMITICKIVLSWPSHIARFSMLFLLDISASGWKFWRRPYYWEDEYFYLICNIYGIHIGILQMIRSY